MQEKELTKQQIDTIFDEAEHQADYVIALYRCAFPNWDDIEKVNGYPSISKATNEYIFKKAIEFDKVNHPQVLNGGLWLNNGFKTVETMKDWFVRPCSYSFTLQPTAYEETKAKQKE